MTPPAVLRERLATARSGSLDFDEAWPVALAAAVNAAQWEREEWRDTLSGMVETWRAAWERRDASSAARAVLALVMPGGTPLPERACENCGEEIPADRHRAARFCSDPCRRHATYLRERSAA
jgi:predicted nucleic acid-binding Zn ribbon protein